MLDDVTLRSLVKPLALALLAGVGAGLLLVFAVTTGRAAPDPGPLHGGGWTNRSRGWITTRGVYDTEFSDGAERPYNWTGGSVRLEIPKLDRARSYRLEFTLEAPRPAEVGRPQIRWAIDGAPAGTHVMDGETGVLAIRLPTSDRTRAVVTMEIGPTFDPGPNDERTLGVVVRNVTLTSEQGDWSPTRDVTLRVAAAAALAVGGVLLCGLSGVSLWLVVALTPVAFVWLTMQDGAFLGDFAGALFNLGLSTAAIGSVVLAARLARPVTAALPQWPLAVGFVLGASVIKLAFFSHPLATIGDGIFQVHRSAMVQNGSYLFTSITPRPFFEFPYAIGLFVTAMPFWDGFTQDVDHVWLLRTLSLVADALVGVALYAVAWRMWARPTAALLVAALWPFARAPLEALCNANLPNVFGQGLFGVAMAGLVWSVAGRRPAMVTLVLSALALAAAFLSHFSTFSVGVPLVGAVALALVARGGADGRRQALWVLAAGTLAVLLAYGVYYRHFGEVYRATVDRVFSEAVVEAPGSAIAATPATKFQRWISGTSDDYGLPGAPLGVMAAAGLVLLARERRHDAFTRALLAWLVVWVGFTALGILTAVQMRVNLAAAPVFVCLGAWAIADLSARGRIGRGLAALATVAIMWNGASLWFMCIGH
jgi:hypothetical protein